MDISLHHLNKLHSVSVPCFHIIVNNGSIAKNESLFNYDDLVISGEQITSAPQTGHLQHISSVGVCLSAKLWKG